MYFNVSIHKMKFQRFWNLHCGFELVSSSKTVFWEFKFLEDSSGSVRRKRVPQVRAREDNQCGYRGSLGLFEMALVRDLTRVLGCMPVSG